MKTIDLNCDMGELKAGQNSNFDAEIMPYISSCNIACGFHSGSPLLIEQTIRAAIAQGVKIGAHPSYNDRENFGRAQVEVERELLLAELRYQIAAVKGMVEFLGHRLYHVKPHGALYNDIAADPELATDFVRLVRQIDPVLKIIGLSGSCVAGICRTEGMTPVNEGFADRRYAGRDQLIPRQHEGAVLHETSEILAQVDDLLAGQVRTKDDRICKIAVESICLHSDTTGAVHLAKTIHDHLQQQNVRIAAIR